jgi:tetratricopeptide (TPR) repeat protein
MIDLAPAIAAVGDHDRARQIVMRPYLSHLRAKKLIELATLAFNDGDAVRAALLISEADLISGRQQAGIHCSVAKIWALNGERDRAITIATRLEADARRNRDGKRWDSSFAGLAKAAAASDDHDRATALCDAINDLYSRIQILCDQAVIAATTGDRDRAIHLMDDARVLSPRNTRFRIARGIAKAAIAVGDHDYAALLVEMVQEPYSQARLYCEIASAAAEAGARQTATRMTAAAEHLLPRFSASGEILVLALHALAKATRLLGEHDRASRFMNDARARVAQPDHPPFHAFAIRALATAVASTGDYDEAETLARKIVDQPDILAQTLCAVGKQLRAARYGDRAVRLLSEAEAIANRLTDPSSRFITQRVLVEAWAEAGDFDRAETILGKITNVPTKAQALTVLAGHLIEAGHTMRARRLIAEVLCTRHWQQTLSLVAKIDPAAFRTACDALLAKVN